MTAQVLSRMLGSNPDLRDHLIALSKSGRADKADLNVIPHLAGKLSFEEEEAIALTLDSLDSMASSPKLETYLKDASAARERTMAVLDEEGQALLDTAKMVVKGSIVFGTLGTILAAIFLPPVVAAGVPAAVCAGGTMATVFGFSRGQSIDMEKATYGRYN